VEGQAHRWGQALPLGLASEYQAPEEQGYPAAAYLGKGYQT
jgi:hypothetical protein